MSTQYNILSSFLSIQTASPFWRSGSLYLGAMHFLWQAVVSLYSSIHQFCGWDLAEWLEHLAVNANVAKVLGSIPASSDTVESEGRQMMQCWIGSVHKQVFPELWHPSINIRQTGQILLPNNSNNPITHPPLPSHSLRVEITLLSL
jgi:hypothetical protein